MFAAEMHVRGVYTHCVRLQVRMRNNSSINYNSRGEQYATYVYVDVNVDKKQIFLVNLWWSGMVNEKMRFGYVK